MVVEDDPMVMELTCDYVDSVGGFRTAFRAGNGGAALDLAASHPVDLIILDIYMPVLSGVDFLTECRKRGNSADVIFLTASNDNKTIDRALKLGAVDYLIKPFTYDRFRESLEKYALRHDRFKKDGETTQRELDNLLGQARGAEKAGLRKGLHPKTLELVRGYLRTMRGDTVAQGDMAKQIGLSSVTIRRYMDFLALENEVVLEVEYGSIGRPRYVFRKIK